MHLWRALLYTELRSCAEWFFCDSVERKMTVVVRIETVSAEIGFSCTCIDAVHLISLPGGDAHALTFHGLILSGKHVFRP